MHFATDMSIERRAEISQQVKKTFQELLGEMPLRKDRELIAAILTMTIAMLTGPETFTTTKSRTDPPRGEAESSRIISEFVVKCASQPKATT